MYLLQTRANGGEWGTKSVADTRVKAAMATTRVVHELICKGHRNIQIRIVSRT